MHKPGYPLLGGLLLTLLGGLLIGYLFDRTLLLALIAVVGWGLWQIWQFRRLYQWILAENSRDLPSFRGKWDDLAYALYRRQREARQRERNLRQVIARFRQSSAALSDAIVILDRNDHPEWWNKAAETLLGLNAPADQHRSLLNILRDPRFIHYYQNGAYQEGLELPSPRDPQITLLYNITLYGEGDRLLVARDITRLKRLEQTRQTFVANASHELRTPLTVMRGYIETFMDQDLPPPLHRALARMEQQSQRMEHLVRDLLLLSRLESDQPLHTNQVVEMAPLLKRILRDAQTLSGEKQHHITLHLNTDQDLFGQEGELHSAFSNLVFNAVRYTPAGSCIDLIWEADAEGGRLCVIDTGPGIAAHHLPRLTERFYRVDESRASESGGTGLGLSIVKHVLVRHNAQLKIDSAPGQGSRFCCHFPPNLLVAQRDDQKGASRS